MLFKQEVLCSSCFILQSIYKLPVCAFTVKSEEAEWYCLDKTSLQPPQSMLDQPHTVFASNNPTATLSSREGLPGVFRATRGAQGAGRRGFIVWVFSPQYPRLRLKD